MRVCTEERSPLVRDNHLMRHTRRFALALALAVVLAVAAVAGTISSRDRDGLSVGELLRLEPVPADPSSPVDGHLQFAVELFGGSRQFTEADLTDRFTPRWAEEFTADSLNSSTDALFAEVGTISFVRVSERLPQLVRLLSVAENGTPAEALVEVADSGRIEGLTLGFPQSPPRLPAWESTLILLAGWVLIVAAAAAWRLNALDEAWTLLATSIPALSGVLVLSDSGLAYTAGRAVPTLVLVFAVALLIGPKPGRLKRWVLAASVAAALAAALAPSVRDSLLIGHPTVVGAFTNSETVYRVLLASSAGLTVVAMGGLLL